MEKVAVAKSRSALATTICITRYGNVMASRGSVIPLFVDQLRKGDAITITNPEMTRFLMSLNDAVDLVMFAFNHGKAGDILVQKSPAATIEVLVEALKELFDKTDHPVVSIGTRHGEKLFETLLSREEMAHAEDMGVYFRVSPDLRDLNYEKFFEHGEPKLSESMDYNSHNTERLNVEGVKRLLLKLGFLQGALVGKQMEPEG